MSEPRPPRVRLALDYGPPAQGLMEWSLDLARRMQAQLDALFIEDSQLYQLAQLPFTHTSRSDSSRGQLDLESLAYAMQRQAQQLELQLRTLADARRIPVGFGRVRGKLLEEVRRACEGTRLLVLQGLQPPRPQLTPLQREVAKSSVVMVVYDGSAAARHTLELAMSTLQSDELHVLIQAADRDQARAQIDAVQALMRNHRITALRTSYLPLHDGEHLVHLSRLERPAAIFLPANNTLLADHPLRELISALPCPLAIVGSG